MASSSYDHFHELLRKSSTSSGTKALFSTWAHDVLSQIKGQDLINSTFLDFSNLLASIPVPDDAGYMSLAGLAYVLSLVHGTSSAFDIIRTYNRLWLALPEAAKTYKDEQSGRVAEETLSQVKLSVGNLASLFLSSSNTPALIEPNKRKALTHQQLSSFIQSFHLPICGSATSPKPVIVLALPNGPLLGLVCLAVSSYYPAAPINTAGGARQFRTEVELVTPQAILVLESDVQKLGLSEPWVTESGIQVILVQPETDMTFTVQPLVDVPFETTRPMVPTVADDISLLLFTSGTSGTKKVVPITCLSLLTGVTNVIDSWGLTAQDSCMNMMPLNHVGGLVRNLFAPVLSGGSTVLCPLFDPNLFWDVLQEGVGTWYYASPSMHMSILAEGQMRPDAISRCRLRLCCNAAGGLLPALAIRLRDTFKCTVLPSYGMTECMPISTPPLDYTLNRSGTSGVACGPDICILDESDLPVSAGQVGRINVRGGPTFGGYLKEGKIDKSAFNKDGWFDTGDLGSLDQDGFLYLTGRGKEVINRGGELISPFEVEEAITLAFQNSSSPLFQRVSQVMAFSAPHELLQEVVGVALVTPDGQPRPDIRVLHAALKSSLHSSKLPVVVVYVNALPTSNNKIVRIKFGERLDLMPIVGETSLAEKHFDAVCPPVNSPLTTKIAKKTCITDITQVLRLVENVLDPGLEAHVGVNNRDGTPEVFVAPKDEGLDLLSFDYTIETISRRLREDLDGFLYPSRITHLKKPLPRLPCGLVDVKGLEDDLKASQNSPSTLSISETELQIRRAYAEVLGLDIGEISSETDFFEMGGDSLSAGRLLSILRRDMQVRIPIDQLFAASKVGDLCNLAERILQSEAKTSNGDEKPTSMRGCDKTHSSTNPLVLIINLLPIVFFYPLKMALQWTVLMYSLSTISEAWDEPNVAARFLALVGAMTISRVSTQIVSPIFGIAFKWVVIGRYKEGMYPMWGPYHTRWWIVQKVLLICGKGVFRHFDITRLIYYRLLGAKIGKGVTIEKGTTLGEYDLLEIGDNVHLNRCICRPFAVERNTTMYLGKIVIGKNSSVGLKSHVAAGSVLPEDTFIGANSSSYEVAEGGKLDRRGTVMPKPHLLVQLFCIIPIQIFVLFVSSLPWMAGLWGIVSNEPKNNTDSVRTIITWWATPHRIAFHYLAQSLNSSVRPFIWLGLLIIIKKIIVIVCGPAKPGLILEKKQKDYLRTHILSALVPNGGLKSFTKLFGSHYEMTSIAVRAMGGKVGKRVYWPGTGPTMTDFDLIDIGDDVVFGSRSHIITSDTVGSDVVKIGNGAMIADRVVLSPGTTVGDGTVLGSGGFLPREQNCPPGSVWVGNRNGSAVCLSHSSTFSSQAPTLREVGDKGTSMASFDKGTPPVSRGSSLYDSTSSRRRSSHSGRFEDNEKKMEIRETIAHLASSRSSTTHSEALTPFGRAFYEGKAPYFVLGQFSIFLYSTFTTIFVQLYWNVGTLSTIVLSQIVNRTDEFHPRWYRPLKIYILDVALLSAFYSILSILAISITIAAKWILLGRRRKGNYDWDKSSYCQRWQIFLTVEAIRRRCFSGNGILGMLTGTHFCVLYFRALGATIGKDCALFAGGRPSLVFTEPDLLTLGDRVGCDDCSLVGHLNSRGHFTLNTLEVGNGSVLRSGSRVLSGAKMGESSMLLEHTLIMAGDAADDGVTYQGWPADVYRR